MDTAAKLIICVILGAFYAPTVFAYEYPAAWDNLRVIDGELHIAKPGGGTALMYPNAGISKEIPVNTSKGNYLVPVEKTFPVEPSKVGKAATRFLKTLPLIGTAVALYDTVCDLTDICKNPQSGELEYAPDIPNGYPAIGEAGRWQHASNSAINEPTLELLCKNSTFKSTFFYAPAFLIYVSSSSSGVNGTCVYRDTSNNPPTTLERDGFAKRNSGTCSANYTLVSGICKHNNAPVPVTESHWTEAETKLNAQPEQTATALYNSDAPVPVQALTQSAPVTQQIAQTSTQTKDAQGNVTGTQVATTSVKVEDISTTNNVTYNVTEVTTITTYNENNEITNTQTQTSDNSPPQRPTDTDTTISFDDVPPDQLEEEEVDLEMPEYESWGEGICPDDVDLGMYGLSISYQPVCEVATDLRPFFLLLASITAVYILSGVSTKD